MPDLATAGLTHLAHTAPVHASVASGYMSAGASTMALLMGGLGIYAWVSARDSEKHCNKLLRGAMWMLLLCAISVSGAVIAFLTTTYHMGSGFGGLLGEAGNAFFFIAGAIAVIEMIKRARMLKGEVPTWGPALAFATPMIWLLGPLEPLVSKACAGLLSGAAPVTSLLGS